MQKEYPSAKHYYQVRGRLTAPADRPGCLQPLPVRRPRARDDREGVGGRAQVDRGRAQGGRGGQGARGEPQARRRLEPVHRASASLEGLLTNAYSRAAQDGHGGRDQGCLPSPCTSGHAVRAQPQSLIHHPDRPTGGATALCVFLLTAQTRTDSRRSRLRTMACPTASSASASVRSSLSADSGRAYDER